MKYSAQATLLLSYLACKPDGSHGFTSPHTYTTNPTTSTGTTPSTTASSSTFPSTLTSLSMSLSPSANPNKLEDFGVFERYSEASRSYRRTVYSHEDWVRHRSSDRFARNLSTVTSSGIYKSLFKEVGATTAVATFLVVWNILFGQYQDFLGVVHDGPFAESIIPILSMPLTPFTLASPSLGLLLVFRTNTSYKRWDEARKNWGMNINHTRDLVRLGTAFYDREDSTQSQAKDDLNTLALCTWAFVRSMQRHLSPEWEDEDRFRLELYQKLPKEQANEIIKAAHRPNRALQDLSTAIENLPMHFMRRNEVQRAVTIFEDNLGSSERILTSPIPVFYSSWTARFLSFWLLALPFGLWGPMGNSWNHIALIPTMAVLSVALFGIEELATQMEEPFTILPMQGFSDKIYNWCREIVNFQPGDNGMPVYYYENYELEMDYGIKNVVAPIQAARGMKPFETIAEQWAKDFLETSTTSTERSMRLFAKDSTMTTTSENEILL